MTADWRQILDKADRTGSGVFVTLVGVQGSSYRRVGARLLLLDTGETVGSISGGCLEGELIRRAKWLIRNGPAVQHYSTSFEETSEMPYGLGCGGELDLLLEKADSVAVQQLFVQARQVLGGVRRRVVTWLPGEGGTLRRAILDDENRRETDGVTTVLFASESLTQMETAWAADVATEPGEMERDGERIFVEILEPPQRLVVFGAGEDARPLVALGVLLGWNVVVADGRRQLATPERFPQAQAVVPLGGDRPLQLAPTDAVVLMTHSYEQDRLLLESALPAGPRYLGLLGARRRSSLLVSEVAERLGWSLARCCERLYAPIGLDLGGDGAEAIALAVVAEIQACVQGKVGLSRRLDPEEVREQISEEGAAEYATVQCALDRV